MASDFLRRRDAWQIGLPTEDPTVYLARIAARSGALSQDELRQMRDAWLGDISPATPIQKAETWALSYVQGIEREGDAVEALAARPAEAQWSVLYPYTLGYYPLDAALGRALWLGGKRDEAMAHLERTFMRCDRFPSIFATIRSDLLYAQALAEQGNVGRACEVYGTMVGRWGSARPRSVTAQQAKWRSISLGCRKAKR